MNVRDGRVFQTFERGSTWFVNTERADVYVVHA